MLQPRDERAPSLVVIMKIGPPLFPPRLAPFFLMCTSVGEEVLIVNVRAASRPGHRDLP